MKMTAAIKKILEERWPSTEPAPNLEEMDAWLESCPADIPPTLQPAQVRVRVYPALPFPLCLLVAPSLCATLLQPALLFIPST